MDPGRKTGLWACKDRQMLFLHAPMACDQAAHCFLGLCSAC